MDEISEQDLELLETSLDGELGEAEQRALAARLGSEPALADAMVQLRSDRKMRHAMFGSLAGGAADAESILAAVKQSAPRQRTQRVARVLRYLGAAACVLVGVVAGWLGRGKAGMPVAPRDASAPHVVTVYQVGLTDTSGQVVWQQFDTPEKARVFAEDVAQWRQRQEQMRNGQVVLVADRF